MVPAASRPAVLWQLLAHMGDLAGLGWLKLLDPPPPAHARRPLPKAQLPAGMAPAGGHDPQRARAHPGRGREACQNILGERGPPQPSWSLATWRRPSSKRERAGTQKAAAWQDAHADLPRSLASHARRARLTRTAYGTPRPRSCPKSGRRCGGESPRAAAGQTRVLLQRRGRSRAHGPPRLRSSRPRARSQTQQAARARQGPRCARPRASSPRRPSRRSKR